ncbi:MAG: LytR/AlgR family response regulator transcription factor [Allomuricauda sp.]
MTIQKLSKANKKLLNVNFRAVILFCIVIYGLAIFQDYLFSKFKSTSFYWSDTMLYNVYWLLFIPFVQFAVYVYSKVRPKTIKTKILYAIASGSGFSSLHIFIFTVAFIIGSNIIYPIPHRFSTIFKNAISNQLQITVIVYLFLPFFKDYLNRKKQQKEDVLNQRYITVKNGSRRIKVDTSTILFIQTDRPYTAVFSINQKLLHDESLKRLEELLDPKVFIRVHRSVIINKNHIIEMSSRNNGDYDGILSNGQSVRFSRHYRKNWNALFIH